tara:strand:- start:1968 stop:2174 length:207 start_codon:yes stop_codon:yes gene_type:complete
MFDNKIDKGVSDQYYYIPDSCFILETRDFTTEMYDEDEPYCNLCGLHDDVCPCYKHIEILPIGLILED